MLGKERIATEDGFAEWGDFSIDRDGQPVTQRLHIAFYAPHELVDAFHRAGVEAGFTSDGAPGPRPQYTPEYYGAFLLDPDGNSVEAVYVAERARARPDRPPVAAHRRRRRRHALLRDDRARMRASRCAGTPPITPSSSGRGGSFSLLAGEPTVNVHIAFPRRQRRRRRLPRRRRRGGLQGQRRARRAPAYHPGYYGAFVLDPDGNNIEAVNHNR